MSNQPNLEALGQSISFIQSLLNDPHPGLSTWCEALSNALDAIFPEQNKQVEVGPFSPNGEYTDLTNGPFRLYIVASKEELYAINELKLSITDGYGNLTDVILGMGLSGTVGIRVVSPLTSDGPDMSIKLFNAEIP